MSVLLEVLAYFRGTGPATTRCTVAQEFLSSRRAVNLADINVSLGIDSNHVRPVELTCLAAAPTKTTKFR